MIGYTLRTRCDMNFFVSGSYSTSVFPLPLVILFLIASLFGPQMAWAGGGPENLVLVVNADSASSKLIANHYIQLRKIPANHVIYLSGIADVEAIGEQQFKENILQPILAAIEERQLTNTIDYVVYSSGFPTKVSIPETRKKLIEQAEQDGQPIPKDILPAFAGWASINSMTFFANSVLEDDPYWMTLNANSYMRTKTNRSLDNPFDGEDREKFDTAIAKLNGEQAEEGIAELIQLAEAHPEQAAVAYHVARHYGKIADATQATAWLDKAVANGWTGTGIHQIGHGLSCRRG